LTKQTYTAFFGLGIAFVLGFVYFLKFQFNYFPLYCLSPLALFALYAAVFHTEKLVLASILLTPLSVTLRELGLSEGHQQLDLSIPTEPLFAGILLLGIFYQLNSSFISRKVLTHPITIIIFIQLVWIAVTTITSEMPVVSIKFLIARLWFICTGFFFMSYLFEKKKNVHTFFYLYLLGLCTVIVITTIKHAGLGFDEEVSDWIPTPFYNDHTAYSAAISMFIPVCFGYLLRKRINFFGRILFLLAFALLFVGLYLSFARAAWASIAGALVFFVTMLLRIRFRTLLIVAGTALIIFFSFQTQIMILLAGNKTDSEGDFANNIESMSNIKTDASNVERINRWSCAIRMFEERPFFGWGPGTYIMQYAPFQKASERTIISNNDGSNGNAHSEYLGPLSEQGLIGSLLVVALALASLFLGYRLYYTLKDRELKILVGSITIGLITYFIHGLANNFLDTDKLSIPFWGFIAALVCIDVYHSNGTADQSKDQKTT
jgi:O-antigen ligase